MGVRERGREPMCGCERGREREGTCACGCAGWRIGDGIVICVDTRVDCKNGWRERRKWNEWICEEEGVRLCEWR